MGVPLEAWRLRMTDGRALVVAPLRDGRALMASYRGAVRIDTRVVRDLPTARASARLLVRSNPGSTWERLPDSEAAVLVGAVAASPLPGVTRAARSAGDGFEGPCFLWDRAVPGKGDNPPLCREFEVPLANPVPSMSQRVADEAARVCACLMDLRSSGEPWALLEAEMSEDGLRLRVVFG